MMDDGRALFVAWPSDHLSHHIGLRIFHSVLAKTANRMKACGGINETAGDQTTVRTSL